MSADVFSFVCVLLLTRGALCCRVCGTVIASSRKCSRCPFEVRPLIQLLSCSARPSHRCVCCVCSCCVQRPPGTGIGLCNTVSRFAGMIAPVLVHTMPVDFVAALFGCVGIFAAVCALQLPAGTPAALQNAVLPRKEGVKSVARVVAV